MTFALVTSDYREPPQTYTLYKWSLEKRALFGHLASYALLDTGVSVPDYLAFLWSL